MKIFYAQVDDNRARIFFETQEQLKDFVADTIMLENFSDGETTKFNIGSKEMDAEELASLPEWDGD